MLIKLSHWQKNSAIFTFILTVIVLLMMAEQSYAAMPISATYTPDQRGVVWNEEFRNASRQNGSELAKRPMSTRYNSINFPSAKWGPSSDGSAYGFILATDVLLVLEGVLYPVGYPNPGIGGYAVQYSTTSLPYIQNVGTKELPLKFTPTTEIANTYWGVGPTSNYDASYEAIGINLRIDTMLYIGPKAKPGILTIKNPMVMTFVDGTTQRIIESGTTIDIQSPEMTCTVTPPGIIDFGTVNLNDEAPSLSVLKFKKSTMPITCKSSSSDAYAMSKVTFSGDADNVDNRRLKLTGLPDVAFIRGAIGKAVPAVGFCGELDEPYQNTSVYFDGSTATEIGKLTVGTNNIPYAFTLCSNGVYQLGSATATATINVSWE